MLTDNRVERIDHPEVKRDSPALAGIDLRATAQSAVVWNTGFNLFRDLLQFVVMLVLVRLLDASAYGQFSLVTSIVGFISIFSFNNFVAYTLQVQTEDQTHYQEHFTAGAVLQLGMFAVANLTALAPAMDSCLRSGGAVAPRHVANISLRMAVRAAPENDRAHLRLAPAPVASCRRSCAQRRALAIGLALAGAGVYALIIPGMVVTFPSSSICSSASAGGPPGHGRGRNIGRRGILAWPGSAAD